MDQAITDARDFVVAQPRPPTISLCHTHFDCQGDCQRAIHDEKEVKRSIKRKTRHTKVRGYDASRHMLYRGLQLGIVLEAIGAAIHGMTGFFGLPL